MGHSGLAMSVPSGGVGSAVQCCPGQCGPAKVSLAQTNFSFAIYSTQDSV